jgi:benzil reductase ((S)-benzoin forming)
MNLAIVTGHSRGLGAALADQLHGAGWQVLGLSRQTRGAPFEEWPADLADARAVAERLQAWLGAQPADALAEAVLVNNAATLTPPGPIDGASLDDLATCLRVGLEAPLLLARAFIAGTRGWTGQRKLLNISSGLGRRAMAGSAPYCAVKGGLDHLSRALALDEARHANGCRVVSLAPGIIDTDMQVQLRGADPAQFSEQARFAAFKREGLLDTPEQAAAKLLRFMARPDFGDEVIADVRG